MRVPDGRENSEEKWPGSEGGAGTTKRCHCGILKGTGDVKPEERKITVEKIALCGHGWACPTERSWWALSMLSRGRRGACREGHGKTDWGAEQRRSCPRMTENMSLEGSQLLELWQLTTFLGCLEKMEHYGLGWCWEVDIKNPGWSVTVRSLTGRSKRWHSFMAVSVFLICVP